MSPALARSLCEAFHGLRVSSSTAIPITRIQLAPFSNTAISLVRKSKTRGRNPYAVAKARETREKNLARQAELKVQREEALVDPVWGRETDFTQLIDSPPVAPPSIDRARALGPEHEEVKNAFETFEKNFSLNQKQLDDYLSRSAKLSAPITTSLVDPEVGERAQREHENAVEALKRIVALGNASSKDTTRMSKKYCVDTFGRHVTDQNLPPDPQHQQRFENMLKNKTPRAGPDTGSSEVQAAILTVKIRKLAKHMEENKKDLHNKRNLRLLCHKRQKILRYLKRSDKGGARYRNVMAAIGLDDAAIENQLYM